MEYVEEKATLVPAGSLQSDAPSPPLHPYDYAEVPLPLYKKALLGIAFPFVLLPLALVRVVMVAARVWRRHGQATTHVSVLDGCTTASRTQPCRGEQAVGREWRAYRMCGA